MPDYLRLVNFTRGNNPDSFSMLNREPLMPGSEKMVKMIVNLLGRNHAETPIIEVSPFKVSIKKEGQKRHDLIEFTNPFFPAGVAIFGSEKGIFTYTITDHSQDKAQSRNMKRYLKSRGKQLVDANITASTLMKLKENHAIENVSIDGPTDEEQFVVLTRPNCEAIAENDKIEVFGLQFVPTQGENVGGKVVLLTRKKQI